MLKRRRDPQDIPTDHMATSGELRQCLSEMLLTDPRDDLDRIQRQKERRVGHTCEWLLKREEFSTWGAKSDSQLLRLVGSPGIGKTIMSIFLVNELWRKVDRTPTQHLPTSSATTRTRTETLQLPYFGASSGSCYCKGTRCSNTFNQTLRSRSPAYLRISMLFGESWKAY
jgi:hypothetical protein